MDLSVGDRADLKFYTLRRGQSCGVNDVRKHDGYVRNFLYSHMAGIFVIDICDTGGYGGRIFPGQKSDEIKPPGGDSQ